MRGETAKSRYKEVRFQFFRSVKALYESNNVMVLMRIVLTLWRRPGLIVR